MLSIPKAGWARVSIGDFSSRASYIRDVPVECLKAMISSYENNLPAVMKFDAEGWEYIVVVDDFKTHIISDDCEEGYAFSTIEIKKDDLARELVDDIKLHLNGWAIWDTNIGCCEEWTEEDRRIAQERGSDLLILMAHLSLVSSCK